MAKCRMHPKALLEMLENAARVASIDSVPINDTLWMGVDEGDQKLKVAARSRFSALIDARFAEGGEGSQHTILDPEEARSLAKDIRAAKLSGAKDSRVDVTIDRDGLVVDAPGGHQFSCARSSLADQVESDGEHLGVYDELFSIANETRTWLVPTRMVLLRQAMKLMLDVKTGGTAKPDDPIEIIARPEGPVGNGLVTVRMGPVRIYQMAAEVDE